jgi:DtxR family transcriptional regulator, Mn-dependent transcriptional regulator
MSETNERVFSQTVEDYVKAIYKLQSDEEEVSTTSLARKIGAKPAATTKMIKHLAELKLIVHTPYYGVRLTPAGEKVALEIIRHHRLLELYLHQALGYGWDEVDAEAEKLEHHISEEFEDKIDRLLDFPLHDPHGDPIPTRDGTIAPRRGRPLSDSQPDETVVILRVRDSSPEALRYLARMGMKLGAKVEVKAREAFDGALTLEVDGIQHSVGQDLAGHVFVENLPGTEDAS